MVREMNNHQRNKTFKLVFSNHGGELHVNFIEKANVKEQHVDILILLFVLVISPGNQLLTNTFSNNHDNAPSSCIIQELNPVSLPLNMEINLKQQPTAQSGMKSNVAGAPAH